MTRNEIVLTARTYLGTPCHYQGRVKGVGIDCVGLIVCVGRDLGVPLKDRTGYRIRASGNVRGMMKYLDDQCMRVEIPVIGDIMVFYINASRNPQHLAIKTDKGMIHVTGRQVTEHILGQEYLDRLLAVYSYPGVAG